MECWAAVPPAKALLAGMLTESGKQRCALSKWTSRSPSRMSAYKAKADDCATTSLELAGVPTGSLLTGAPT